MSSTAKFDAFRYTIGWICALPTELQAAQQFLDQRHEYPDYSPAEGDNNSYAFGAVGNHNVVIAVLPLGKYGTTSAATVARDLLRSFQNIRIALMVGIGGGAPILEAPPLKWKRTGGLIRDIRLGDVVVSSPGNGKGGVYQYDYGKAIQNQQFLPTGHLNAPPLFVLTAIASLEVDFEAYGHNLHADVEAVLTSNPRLRAKYGRPEKSTDRLYRLEFVHQGSDGDDCADKCLRDESQIISRNPRSDPAEDSTVHYGLIASANTLMRDARTRDSLAREHGILCFEMEASGLADQSPFLVIRGICDYSDTHKNKQWQGYASMTAAAYAKRLLLKLARTRVETEDKLGRRR